METSGQPRKWEQAVLAARVAGIHRTTVNAHAARDARFAAELDFVRSTPRRKTAGAAPQPRRIASKLELFLTRLAETSNVAAAADEAELATATVYARRRTDPDFARRWYAALAEGYDNLEMELLAQLRSGESGGAEAKRKLDVATALRCLTAHRESVAREKGRRTLAEEVATIAAINAKIDAMRARAKQGEAAVRAARKAIRKRAGGHGQG